MSNEEKSKAAQLKEQLFMNRKNGCRKVSADEIVKADEFCEEYKNFLDNAKIDIADTLGVLDCYIQCKRTKNSPNIESISEACPLKDKPLVIFWNKESDRQQNNEYVYMPKEYFF